MTDQATAKKLLSSQNTATGVAVGLGGTAALEALQRKLAARWAARAAVKAGTKAATSSSMGPVAAAALATAGLDLWDPFQLQLVMTNRDLKNVQEQYRKVYEKVYAEMPITVEGVTYTGATLPAKFGGPVTWPNFLTPSWPEVKDDGHFVDAALEKRYIELIMKRLSDKGYNMPPPAHLLPEAASPEAASPEAASPEAASPEAASAESLSVSPQAAEVPLPTKENTDLAIGAFATLLAVGLIVLWRRRQNQNQ